MPDSIPVLGVVSYLNAVPLVAPFADDPAIVADTPAGLVGRLERGELALALVPSIEVARHPEWEILPDAGAIVARGAVRSVLLAHRVPLADVRTLALDDHSRTSAVLARLVLAHAGATPVVHAVRAEPRHWPTESASDAPVDAMLVIGDKALTATWSAPAPAVCDLGAAWCEMTGLPFVFAVWAAVRGRSLGPWPERLRAANAALRGPEGHARRAALGRAEAPRRGIAPDVGMAYLTETIHYDFGAPERAGLDRFFSAARDLNFSLAGPRPASDLAAARLAATSHSH